MAVGTVEMVEYTEQWAVTEEEKEEMVSVKFGGEAETAKMFSV